MHAYLFILYINVYIVHILHIYIGLRWVCHERVTIKYHLNTWLEHRERLAGTGYTPAGPLLDITITDGKLEEVYLPHWICIDDISDVSDKFAVLHMELCGDAVEVEQVSEVTPSHVKLTQPHFSLKGILIRLGFQQRVYCSMLIYRSSISFLTLHVYLIQRDPGLQEAINKRKLSSGYQIIEKPYPVEALKINDRFFLTANLDTADISPEANHLIIEEDPNFYEVFIRNPDIDFMLTLRDSGDGTVWTHEIRHEEYQSRNPAAAPAAGGSSTGAAGGSSPGAAGGSSPGAAGGSSPGAAGGSSSGAAGGSSSGAAGPPPTVQEVEDFLKKNEADLIQGVTETNVNQILDALKAKKVIDQECYMKILKSSGSSQDRMRDIFSANFPPWHVTPAPMTITKRNLPWDNKVLSYRIFLSHLPAKITDSHIYVHQSKSV
ncbi:NACHT, LRR and PYD domains-containing protein 1b allele 3-like isoform X1 [Genypterus blacodes]|uniref:NACHT, LRR and PYD domains-containing protein 1b allele 3-like isoform X1 n=1 Tax=Genypterus blacodes TaxID=154954 RepID=UPI003F7621E7